MKLLIVEDEPNLLSVLRKGFTENNYEVSICLDGETALEMILNNDFDVVVLDVMLPKVNGIEICRRLRAMKNFVPILLLTALGTSENIVNGLENGADDYLVKPFHFEELFARVNALLRRKDIPQQQAELITIADLQINENDMTVFRAGNEIKLTPKEFKLILMLVNAKGKTLSKAAIADQLWDYHIETNQNTIEVYINFLRKKIDKDHDVKLIKTKIGYGYYLTDSE